MVGLRDAEAFRAKSIELQTVILESLSKAIEAREAQAQQLDTIRALEAGVARLQAWDAEKERYELKAIGQGAVAFVLKPDARGSETPYWLCPNCYAKGHKAYLLSKNRVERGHLLVGCNSCGTTVAVNKDVRSWAD